MGGLIYLIGLSSAVWVIYEVWVVNTRMDDTAKVLWTFIALLANILAAILYYFMHKRKLG